MIRSVSFVGVVICALCFVHGANATTVAVNLNLEFTDPSDISSGGDWTVSALAGNFGLAGIIFDVDPANFTGNFLISNTIFEVQAFIPNGSGTGFEFVVGDGFGTPTLNVGVGGSGVELVTGTFDAGDIPALFNVDANLYNAAGGAVGVLPQNLSTSVTSNFIPEPTTGVLLGLGLMSAVMTARRRR